MYYGHKKLGFLAFIPKMTENYLLKDGMRFVIPYTFHRRGFAKKRWLGRTLIDIYGEEFSQVPETFIRNSIEQGLIKINGETFNPDYTLVHDDLIESTHHKHELPIPFFKNFEIIHEDEEIVVINKPPGVPIHWGHKHQKSSVVGLFEHLHNLKVYVVHRIDRLTTGVLILAKSSAAAKKWTTLFAKRELSKFYIARVCGNFPNELITVNQKLRPIETRDRIIIAENGKEAKTHFLKLKYLPETDESIVQCFPETGRTHQIRVHLEFMKHTISNDPIYCPNVDKKHYIPIDLKTIPDHHHVETMCYICSDIQGWFDREWDYSYFHKGLYLHASAYWGKEFRFEANLPSWTENVQPFQNLEDAISKSSNEDDVNTVGEN